MCHRVCRLADFVGVIITKIYTTMCSQLEEGTSLKKMELLGFVTVIEPRPFSGSLRASSNAFTRLATGEEFNV